jgi:ribosomal protein L34
LTVFCSSAASRAASANRTESREATDVKHHRKSYAKRRRKHGFRARMKTANGRKTISNKRRVGRSVTVREKI